MKEIPLTQGKVAIVDDEDYGYLMQWKWRFHSGGYAVTNTSRKDGKRKLIYMHRLVMNASEDIQVDHVNRKNKLDNRKENLRLCNQSQNNCNKEGLDNSSSLYKGVVCVKPDMSYQMQIALDHKTTSKMFSNEIAAANYYNHLAKEIHGEFALLNNVPFMSKDECEKYIKYNKKGKYAGVDFNKQLNKWRSRLKVNKQEIHIGYFNTEDEAVLARNDYIIKNKITKVKIQNIQRND